MYTLPMSWTVRALALTLVMLWGFVPQIACFMPDTPEAHHDCGMTNVSPECCRTAPRTEQGIAAKEIRKLMPGSDLLKIAVESPALPIVSGLRQLPIQISHAPPPDIEDSSLLLRI